MSRTWRQLVVRIVAAACAVVSVSADEPPATPSPKRVVIAELFTSEGCSSCPPADRLLQTIVATQPIEGIEVVGLEEHVDYWDQQGWRDPFSSALLTRRQSEYAASVFHIDDIYTPQLVVNGERECIGGDAAAVRKALGAPSTDTARVELSVEPPSAGRLRGRVMLDGTTSELRGSADVMLAVVQDDLATPVRGGENAGRVLAHAGVVRLLTAVRRVTLDTLPAAVPFDVAVASNLQSAHLRIVAFVQDRGSRRIVGGAVARVPLG